MEKTSNTYYPKVQRALVLSGGGALGAYQAGVVKSLYKKFSNLEKKDGKPFFDIIMGTSIGAINGSILVSHFLENKTWEGVSEKLESFWKYLSMPTPDISESAKKWKQQHEKGNPSAASGEAARRYYSVKEFSKKGIENVYRPRYPPKEDERFFDIENKWLVYDNHPLRKSIERFANFPIATCFDKGEPRFLAVAVDVAEGTTVTFDSYENEKGKRQTVYGSYLKERPIMLEYNEGISIKHVMASSAIPEVYAYEEIGGRKFWDGGVLSYTPIRELIDAHQSFWESRIGADSLEKSFKDLEGKEKREANTEFSGNIRIPDLELYVVNLRDSSYSDDSVDIIDEYKAPQDIDGVRNRHSDISLGADHDLSNFYLFSDYVNLIENLIGLGNQNPELRKKINAILDKDTPRRYPTEKYRKNIDILKNTFKLLKVVYIQRKEDKDVISGKISDFTIETINRLIEQGYRDTLSR